MKDYISYMRHHDDEFYDEVTIRTEMRYKTSGMSGDEWRVGAVLQLKRKGEVIWEKFFTTVKTAVAALPWFFITASEGEIDLEALKRSDLKCAQPGCSNEPTTVYRLKKKYSNDGVASDPAFETRIRFCQKHVKRGDCGLEDSDQNYELVSGEGPEKADWAGADIRESAQVVVNCNSMEEVGVNVAQALKDRIWEDSEKQ